MDKQSFESTVKTIFEGMEKVVSTRTVVGDPQFIGDTTIVPLVDVSFGMGAGFSNKEKKNGTAGGMDGKISPSAVLLIKDGTTRLVNVRDQDVISKAVDLVPDVVNRVSSFIKDRGHEDPVVKEAVDTAVNKAVKAEPENFEDKL